MYRIAVEAGVRCAVQDLNPKGRRTILFVHGWPLDQRIFEWQYSVLPQYGIRCISIDLRGFGQSDRPFHGYSYNRMADDLYKIISSLDDRNITLCGFSMGGAICIRYMARHNGFRVGKLVLMGAAAPSFVQRAGYPYGMTTQQVDTLIAHAYQNRPLMCENFGEICFSKNYGSAFMDWFRGIGEGASGYSTIKCAESLRDEDLRSDLQKVRVATAIFHGVLDRVCPFAFAEEMRKGIVDSFIVPFSHSGHCLFYEEKDQCNSSLIDFINTK